MNEALAAKLRDAPASFYPHHLVTSYPQVVERILALWGRAEIEAYFRELMRGDQQGFSQAVHTEILNLRTWYRSGHPPQ